MNLKSFTLSTGIALMAMNPAIASQPDASQPDQNYPPFIQAPKDAKPVVVTVELIAKDSKTLQKYLKSAPVIPTTRLASGINYSYTYRDETTPNRFVLIQSWNSKKQQQDYINWRVQRGDLAELRSFLTQDPVVNYLNPVDLTTLPSQAK